MTELEIIVNRVYFLAITELVMAAAELVAFAFLSIIYFKIRTRKDKNSIDGSLYTVDKKG